MKRVILIGLVVIMLVGCQPMTVYVDREVSNGTQPVNTARSKVDNLGYGFYRMIDYDAGIVCYAEDTMQCFDIDDTWLSKE